MPGGRRRGGRGRTGTFGVAQCALRTSAGPIRRLAADPRDGRRRHAGDLPRRAPGVLPAPRRPTATATWEMSHQTAMYYQDRLGGRGFARVLVGGTPAPALTSRRLAGDPGAARRARSRSRSALVVRRAGCAGHLEAMVPAFGMALSLRAERVGSWRMHRRINLSTRPFYNERGGACRSWRWSRHRAGRHGVQPVAGLRAVGPAGRIPGAHRAGRAEDARVPGAGGHDPRVDQPARTRRDDRRRARGQRAHRAPRVLVDRAVQPARDDAARRCASRRSGRSVEKDGAITVEVVVLARTVEAWTPSSRTSRSGARSAGCCRGRSS